jgi:hypothetical protein
MFFPHSTPEFDAILMKSSFGVLTFFYALGYGYLFLVILEFKESLPTVSGFSR